MCSSDLMRIRTIFFGSGSGFSICSDPDPDPDSDPDPDPDYTIADVFNKNNRYSPLNFILNIKIVKNKHFLSNYIHF